jgi:hypothetical protein
MTGLAQVLANMSDGAFAFIVVYTVVMGWLVYNFDKYNTLLEEEE